ncbi:cytochrome [Parafrankia colletiae]|uniref:Cytochrome n=1 Tax=Parafrankia colletiae TaxID=573497 RepID=A0A1S1R309_9ACTN|nr:cytochrome P450 [Parafrankia colletiae]MCK9903751.1 cytochrome P450 [Frankia sp. Cpl3]OHV40307.1 cytochrome [Parafrankia colletiae]
MSDQATVPTATHPPASPEFPEFPTARRCPFAEPAGYPELRAQGPLSQVTLYNGRRVWIVTGYDEGRRVLADHGSFSSVRADPRFPATAPRFEAARAVRNFIGMDPPGHTTQRRMLTASFTVRRINDFRPRIQQIVDTLLDGLLRRGTSADLVPDFALPVPSTVICDLLGVPYDDHAFFEAQARRIVHGDSSQQDSADAFTRIRLYLEELIRTKRTKRGDGLLDELITEHVDQGELDTRTLAEISLLLLVAGHETTANAIALGVLTLLERPDVLRRVRAEPAAVADVVEELLRHLSIADGAARFATRDVEIAGQPVREGDGVIVAIAAMNRDSAVFGEPDAFDPRRSARRHVAFGYGIHQCLGQNLARAEMEIALTSLFRRIPDLRLAVGVDELELRHPAGLHGVVALPVEWETGSAA